MRLQSLPSREEGGGEKRAGERARKKVTERVSLKQKGDIVKKVYSDGKRWKMQREIGKGDKAQIEKDIRDILTVNNCHSAFE